MSQMNPEEVFHNTAYSVRLPYIEPVTLFKSKPIFKDISFNLDKIKVLMTQQNIPRLYFCVDQFSSDDKLKPEQNIEIRN